MPACIREGSSALKPGVGMCFFPGTMVADVLAGRGLGLVKESRSPLPDWGEFHALRSRSEEHTSELQSLMRISYAVFCLKKKKREKHSKITYTHIAIR